MVLNQLLIHWPFFFQRTFITTALLNSHSTWESLPTVLINSDVLYHNFFSHNSNNLKDYSDRIYSKMIYLWGWHLKGKPGTGSNNLTLDLNHHKHLERGCVCVCVCVGVCEWESERYYEYVNECVTVFVCVQEVWS